MGGFGAVDVRDFRDVCFWPRSFPCKLTVRAFVGDGVRLVRFTFFIGDLVALTSNTLAGAVFGRSLFRIAS